MSFFWSSQYFWKLLNCILAFGHAQAFACALPFPLLPKNLFFPSAYQVVSIYSLSKRNMERHIYGEELRLEPFQLACCTLLPPGTSVWVSASLSLLLIHVVWRAAIHPPLWLTELSETSTCLIFSQLQSCLPTHGITAAVSVFLSFLGLFCERVSQSVHSLHLHKTLLSGKNISPSVIPRLLFLKAKVAAMRRLCTLLCGRSVKICKDLPSHCLERAWYGCFHPVLAPCVSGCSHSAWECREYNLRS